MRILFIFLFISVITSAFTCNKSEGILNDNPYKVSLDPNTFFKISISGKSLSTNGIKFGVSSYELMAFEYCYASVSTNTVSGKLISDITLEVSPLYSSLFGDFGIKDGDVEAYITATRNGDALGAYTLESYCEIVDISQAKKTYEIDQTKSNFTVTSIDSKYVKGTFNLALINGSSIIPATGTFSLLKL